MDIRLHYLEKGSGEEVLLLLHGNGGDCTYFRHQMAYFSQQYRVIALDTRGHGASPRGGKPFTIVQFAEDLHDFLIETGIAQANILGFSDGGNIALTFALKYPDFVKKLILNGANLDPSGLKAWFYVPVLVGYRFASLFAAHSRRAKYDTELWGLMVNEPQSTPEQLAALTMPVLVIAGTHDIIPRKHTLLMHKRIPGSVLELIRGGHSIAAKAPEAFNSAVMRFLQHGGHPSVG